MNPFKINGLPRVSGKTHASCAALFLLLGTMAHAQKPLVKGYDAFPTIRTRNVFDPERRPIQANRDPQERRSSGRTRPNFITITGTMVSGTNTLAFFSGSQPEYSKVIGVHDKIADFTITAISAEKVDFERAGTRLSVLVGAQIPLNGSAAAGSTPVPDEGGESSDPAPATETTSPPATSPTPGTTAPPAGAAPAGDKAEVLRRMMERRKKEI
ncbi:MAG: hypothetical protein JWL59_723 [Chthoniobacteraceae bacterium]|nr:hypothetical protein [Chthoniobacteraceae bacterium]